MTGATMALAAGGAAAGSGGVTAPGPLSWTAIYDYSPAFTNTLTISGVTSPITISAARTGLGILLFSLNGVILNYSGAFAVHAGDTLAWGVACAAGTKTGVITVTNVTASTTLATIAYTVTG